MKASIKKYKGFYKLLVLMMAIVLVMGVAGTVALAAEGDGSTGNVTDNTTAGGGTSDNFTSDNLTGGSRDGKPVPPGQLVRRGLSGPIVGVGDGYVLIETNFGVVKVYTDEETDESMIGSRVAVKLGKTEGGASGIAKGDDDTGDTGGSTDNSTEFYREATAEQFKLIPGKGSKEHRWGTIETTDEGCTFVDDEGNTVPTECGGDEEVVGLLTTGDGEGDGEPELLGIENTSRIQERIEARLAKAEDDGDEKALERLQRQLDRYEEKQAERQARAEERAAIRAEKGNNKGQGNREDKGNQGNQGGGGQGKDK